MTDAPTNGKWVSRPEPPHRCEPPSKRFGEVTGPDGLAGWVWECGCGQRWVIVGSPLFPNVKGGLFGPAWRPLNPPEETP